MNKKWTMYVLLVGVAVVAAFAYAAVTQSVAYTSVSSGQQNTASMQDYGSHEEGEAPLHPDMVHGLVPSPPNAEVITDLPRSRGATRFSESPVVDKSPLHPDMVHGLVPPPSQPDVAGDQRSIDNQ